MTSRFADIDWILWSGTVGLERPIPERVEAAIAAGDRTPAAIVAVKRLPTPTR